MRQDQSRVLIVDDEAFFVEAIDEILTTAGFLTRRAADGASAHHALRVDRPGGRSRSAPAGCL
jgi:PleD family two-component response regulator